MSVCKINDTDDDSTFCGERSSKNLFCYEASRVACIPSSIKCLSSFFVTPLYHKKKAIQFHASGKLFAGIQEKSILKCLGVQLNYWFCVLIAVGFSQRLLILTPLVEYLFLSHPFVCLGNLIKNQTIARNDQQYYSHQEDYRRSVNNTNRQDNYVSTQMFLFREGHQREEWLRNSNETEAKK